MPTKPAKPKIDKRVVLTKKANVSTPEHSELLQWLVANHEYICGQYFYHDVEWYDQAVEAAIQRFRKDCENAKQNLAKAADNERYLLQHRALCKKRIKELAAISGEPEMPDFDQITSSFVVKMSVQARTFSTTTDRYGKTEEKAVGFVDIQALSRLPSSLRLQFADNDIYGSDEETLAATAIYAPKWRRDECFACRSWFDVWSELPSLGDLLQHLKMLAELNTPYIEGSNKYHRHSSRVVTRTFLVVPEISPSMADIISHEGFIVISRKEIDAELAELVV